MAAISDASRQDDKKRGARTGGLRVSGCFNPEPDLDNANVGRDNGSQVCVFCVQESLVGFLHFFNMKKANSMNITREQLKLYAVTDRSWLGAETLYEQVEKALKGGVTLVRLGKKLLMRSLFEKEGQELLELCHHYNVPLIINDNVKLAKKIHADGVHIGQSDMEIKNARELLEQIRLSA